MAFITKNNARQLEYQVDRSKVGRIMIDDLYKLSLWMLTKNEQQRLGAARMFYENPDFYIKHIYQKEDKKEEQYFVYPPGRPAYHADKDCVILNGGYINYKIPVEIVERIKKGQLNIREFRDWWASEEQLLNSDPDRFQEKMSIRWLLTGNVRNQQVTAGNSGVEIYENNDLSKVTLKIDELIESMAEVRKNNFPLIDEYGKVTYKILVTKEILIEDPNSLKILTDWNDKKILLKREMRLYFQLRFNPDIEIKDSLLESLGFVKCNKCHKVKLMPEL